ncbi:MAG TPA: helical backbone metal receptor [Vicinamibacterales bacterium]|jgi:iron complex transport system substrate-binding protein|nr:helical backbone metal receptor [Vicinamibacterales bacterium]
MSIRSLCLCVAALTLFFARSSPSASSSQPVNHPKRIISLIPAVTEMVYAIGAGPQLVGVGSFDTYPSEVASLPRVGGLLDPDVERILALKPDLVIVYGTQNDLRLQLERAGINQFSYKHGSLAGVMETIRALGIRLGRAEGADRVATDLENRLSAIRGKVSGRVRPKTLLVFGRDALALRGIFASGGIGFIHDMLTTAGGDNVFTDVTRESVQATTELILQRAPEAIIEMRQSVKADEIAAERAVWSTLSSLPAVRTARIYILTDSSLPVPGPRVAQATESIAKTLHPEAFR